jgi:hypothetical protein
MSYLGSILLFLFQTYWHLRYLIYYWRVETSSFNSSYRAIISMRYMYSCWCGWSVSTYLIYWKFMYLRKTSLRGLPFCRMYLHSSLLENSRPSLDCKLVICLKSVKYIIRKILSFPSRRNWTCYMPIVFICFPKASKKASDILLIAKETRDTPIWFYMKKVFSRISGDSSAMRAANG